ncbi:DinB family protein [Flaviaesturariibacter flavus]|uniref:DinB family protein n=1 Tax=Flaviaesturariibacter flavus TaxID=2502780 RepID=A0A4R1BPI4_9BACT|nr:DinB family protein [Flaviaesturariibacter flavus]TCJ19237.1 DinB family protein [Flaviaesturariibacter flavus]
MANVDYNRIPEYYHRYVRQVEDLDLEAALRSRRDAILPVLRTLPDQQWDFAYAAGKWTIKELVLHIIDAERIFAYRALRFSRQDSTPLPSFDENRFAEKSEAGRRSPSSLLRELETVLDSTDTLFEGFSAEQLNQEGVASNNPVYVRGIAYIICGHILHHVGILKERYLQPATA